MITLQSIRRIARRWATSHSLDVISAPLYPFHDYIHARFGLGTHEEGLVVEIERSVQGPMFMQRHPFWSLAAAREACDKFNLHATERWSDDRAREVFKRAIEVLGELKQIRGMLPYRHLDDRYMRQYLGIDMKNPPKQVFPEWWNIV